MAVYVDWLRKTPRTSSWPYTQSCHMLADSVEELHAFAASIGMKREWFHPGSTPHYDLTATRQKLAIARGAQRLRTREELVALVRHLRKAAACSPCA